MTQSINFKQKTKNGEKDYEGFFTCISISFPYRLIILKKMLRLFAENNLCVFWLLSDGLKEKKIDKEEEEEGKRNVESR